ncbi:30S ribosomal protein S30e [Staphylothermus hellenicus]|uniref:Ribosomal protein S30 n=1 Tax=Staphylothermus hellenicus (strain DSM 12710 / JCM 10830 / BK20S6-10-b1 / P8) TaxID=591019 RepID=D7D950_STAHD|nr:30S ribosomal protein S30e [Staphylothermus hellenicus]ADI32296.1 Ribosomal protein S30 [Staphylothermus hellenicus DSM 12710]
MPSHGSLTKAGKVRSQTPKIPPKPKKNMPPRMRNRWEYVRRIVLAAQQQSFYRRRR